MRSDKCAVYRKDPVSSIASSATQTCSNGPECAFLVSLVCINEQDVNKHIQEEYEATRGTRQVHKLMVYLQFSPYFSQLFLFLSSAAFLLLCRMSREYWFKLDLVSSSLGNDNGSPVTPLSVLTRHLVYMQTFSFLVRIIKEL